MELKKKAIIVKITVVVAMLSLGVYLTASASAEYLERPDPGIEGMAAWYLRLHTNATNVMSSEVETAYYAGILHTFFPNGFVGELSRFGFCEVDYIINYAKRWNVSHIMIDKKITNDLNCPELKAMYNQNFTHPNLKFLIELKRNNIIATMWEVV